ncbi:MAG TPA: S24 family peptidase [Chromatiaceae bacterium]|nr:S24 family peptidase [Chromatiaceae bacterium]
MSDCSYNEPFALQVLGDSMEPEFPDQCIIVLERADRASNGMYVMALVEGVRWFRQYLNDEQGERLVALNELYPEIPLEGLDWHVEAVCYQRNINRKIKHYRY